MRKYFIGVAVACLFILGCNNRTTEGLHSSPSPSPTPVFLATPTATPQPTATPIVVVATPFPTPSPTATPTPAPVATPTPTPIPIPALEPIDEIPTDVVVKNEPIMNVPDVVPVVVLPKDNDILSPEGRVLIYEFEVGGGKSYYNKLLKFPTWPGASSGVTIGIGYDLGYNSINVFKLDWQMLPSGDLTRLGKTIGLKGQAAKAVVKSVKDILVTWEAGEAVFNKTTVVKFYELAKRTYPGLEDLKPNAQAAITSLVFNRGNSLVGERRTEMRDLKPAIANGDYALMAKLIRKMKRVWKGTDIEAGMYRRRDAEAALIETCLKP